MPDYYFRVRRYDYYMVSSPLLGEARKILEDCEDMADYDVTQEMQTLEDLQPNFELIGIMGKEDV